METAKKDETAAIYPIASLSFRVAKTMPEIPHEYVVRKPENEEAYVALFDLIVERGVHEIGAGANPILVPGRWLEILANGQRRSPKPSLKSMQSSRAANCYLII